ncbi:MULTISPECIES: phenylalanine--tRNA ligase subunit beta [unclassified Gemella]|uniref:phenylalanine--tRNA ligase subunit beta n=1 Tax=unclassified Gemella TaxID=2624949 RepID=UPI001073B4B3|nr:MULTISPECIES: phenylalanine--tRNA ligase subunit beta [unclassified Gemella]MBF0709782.1 phenylalanine--tRNA ligase subunit beta [Gemella sp. GL1.1]MBF0747130.1 phenylalanine--tRNA ligase subunit beta [Gemella sp. 19428wG2_WT2a]NYS27126.1 phenylalanine--tRNA ligase subunit beta [Gemella sp. GL1]TFU58371.1 phenylalanine--tRNA ligase subunit beta [Gemella sp. WT2a]
MLLSYNWLKELVNIEDSVEILADKITRGGLEVEEVIRLDANLSNLVVGYVESKEKHPDAEKLNVCQVNVGDEILQIVCGAANVDAGQYVIVAKPGAKLPGIKIKKAKLRGVESNGMICSLKELGFSSSVLPKKTQDGIFVFEEKVTPGQDAIELLGLNDSIIDIAITPNRADALSMRGLVYEISALYNKEVNFEKANVNKGYEASELTVKVDSSNCINYLGQVVKNVEINDSPLWMQSKLMKSGIRPINNIVDITNYILLEYGQPMHAFDKDLLGTNILVRQANVGEKLITLDGEERELTVEDLVITDAFKPVALAGVMGGKHTEVSDSTKDIVLESAYFNPISIRRTSSRHGLRSDSSVRFEKGIDANMQRLALSRALELILEFCPKAAAEEVVAVENKFEEKEIKVSTSYLNNYIGINLKAEDVENLLKSLSFAVERNEDELFVKTSSRRPDITIKQDLVEEVARLYGYDNIKSTLPLTSKAIQGGLTYKQRLIRELRKSYLSLGFNDTINYSLVSEKEADQFTLMDHHKVKLLMPMTETHSTLRQSQVPGLLTTLAYNKARRQENLKLLEIGKVFFGSGDDNIQPEEVLYLTGVLSGKDELSRWQKEENKFDFFTAKAYLEVAFKKLGLSGITYKKSKLDLLHPGRTASVFYKGEEIGFIGAIHPEYARQLDLDETYVFEINLDKVLTNDKVSPIYTEVSKYPTVTRDIAMLLDKEEAYSNIENLILGLNNRLIKSVDVFDVYQGIGLASGKKSVAISIAYNDSEKTLTEEEITAVHNKVLRTLEEYGAIIR